MHLLETIIVGIGCGFVSSMASLALWFHFDLEGWWEQKHIERGKRMEEKELERKKNEAARS